MANTPSAKTMAVIRDYVAGEPSFTAAFAAWDLKTNRDFTISAMTITGAIRIMADEGQIELIEDAGRAGKVYAWVKPKPAQPVRHIDSRLPELDAHRYAVIADLAPERGEPVAGTGRPHIEGPYSKGLKARRNLAKRQRHAA